MDRSQHHIEIEDTRTPPGLAPQTFSGTRRTQHIARRPASALLHSNRIAEAIGRPINTEVIIRFWFSTLPAEIMSKTFETSIRGRRFAYWSRPIRNGHRVELNGPPTYVWVAEGGPERPHIHWCLHLADGQRESFEKNLQRWVSSVPELAAVAFEELVTIRDVWDIHRYKLYLVKGMDPRFGKAWNVRRIAPQGEIVGKRSGVSKNLTRAARKALNL